MGPELLQTLSTVRGFHFSDTLRWKGVISFSGNPLIKDTIIAPGWHYEIAVLEYEVK
jgi:hypothetical protein